MLNRPMVTNPGFTFEDAADTSVEDLEKFRGYELVQMLAEAENAYESGLVRIQDLQSDIDSAASFGPSPQIAAEATDFYSRKMDEVRLAMRVAERAAARLYRAYGKKQGLQ